MQDSATRRPDGHLSPLTAGLIRSASRAAHKRRAAVRRIASLSLGRWLKQLRLAARTLRQTLLWGAVMAATFNAPAVLSRDSTVELGKIEVTGQKVTRTLQETTDSVTTISGEKLQASGISDLREAFRLAPNINYSPSNNGNNGFSIRGINSEGVGSPGGNQQPLSSLVIDGAVQSLEGVRKGARGTWDIESVEVLRGPQITQGRNALAGAVIVKSRDPTPEFEGSARFVLDSLGQERAAVLSGPITKNQELMYRFSVESFNKEKSISYADPELEFLNEEDFYSFRTKFLWEPLAFPNFSSMFTWSRAHDDPAITAVTGPNFFQRRLNNAFASIEQRVNDVDNFTLDLNYYADSGIDFTSVSTLTRTFTEISAPAPEVNRDETREDLDFSQDLRANYESEDGRFKMLLGAFFGRYNNDRDSVIQRLVPEILTSVNQRTVSADSCLNLDFAADGDGRWFEFFSDAFAQINQGFAGSQATDGFFLISSLPGFTQIGSGADVFPFEGAWDSVGAINLDLTGFTGVGVETAPVNSGQFDFARYVADDDNILSLGYTTQVSNPTGSVTFNNGTVTSIDTDLDVVFTYDATSFGLGLIPFTGTLSLDPSDRFSLRVGDRGSPIGSINYAWEFDGDYSLSAASGTCPPGGAPIVITEVTATPTGRFVFGTFQDLVSESERRNYAVYTQGEWRVAKKVRLIAGFRADFDRVHFKAHNRLTDERTSGNARFSAFLPRVGIGYDFTPFHSVTLTASRGYRGGFLSTERGFAQIESIDPEFLWSYELALRSLWYGGRLSTNANLFYYDWTDQQINVRDPINPVGTLVRNAGESKAFGAEIQISARPNDRFQLDANLGLLRTRFVEFETDIADFSGNEFPEAPRVSASVLGIYRWPLGWFAGADATFQSKMFATSDLENDPDRQLPSRFLLNVRGGYEDPKGRFRIMAEISNALDKDYLTGRDINTGAYVGDERVFSLSTQINF